MKLQIKPTEAVDLQELMILWNDGRVMRWVEFPEGLGVDIDYMHDWLERIQKPPMRRHYTVRTLTGDFVGETFYWIDETKLSAMDIKLTPEFQGQALARPVLRFALEKAFAAGAERCYVEPLEGNAPAWRLYRSLGFQEAIRPAHLDQDGSFLVLEKTDFKAE